MIARGESWTLHLGDCLDVLRAVDTSGALVVCDPPYGVAERTNRKSAGRGKLAPCNDFPPVIGDDRPFDPAPFLSLPRVVLWGANHFAGRLPDASCWLVWDKREGLPSNDNADCELAWTNLRGPARLFAHRWNGMIRASEKAEPRLHPTQKPVALMRWIGVDPKLWSESSYLALMGAWVCHYCGGDVRRWGGHGIDRIDSCRKHVPDNCLPCCWACNRAKGPLAPEFFRLAIIDPLVDRWGRGKVPWQTVFAKGIRLPDETAVDLSDYIDRSQRSLFDIAGAAE